MAGRQQSEDAIITTQQIMAMRRLERQLEDALIVADAIDPMAAIRVDEALQYVVQWLERNKPGA